MSILVFPPVFLLRVALLLLPVNVVMLIAGLELGWERASAENGIIENTQIVVLAISMGVALYAATRSARLLRVAMAGWAAMMLLFIQREVPYSTFGRDAWFYELRHVEVRLTLWAPVLVLLLLSALRYISDIARSILSLRLRHVWPALIAAALTALSVAAEEAILAGYRTYTWQLVFLEELLELNAYILIAAIAVMIALRLREPLPPEQAEARNSLSPSA